jgi:hypothetical protein
MQHFNGLWPPLALEKALKAMGFEEPTPIQVKANSRFLPERRQSLFFTVSLPLNVELLAKKPLIAPVRAKSGLPFSFNRKCSNPFYKPQLRKKVISSKMNSIFGRGLF